MSKSTAKYRPSLSAETIEHLIVLAKKDLLSYEPVNQKASTLALSILAPFQAKIQNSGIVPAYSVSDKIPLTLAESLGMVTVSTVQTNNPSLTKEEYWEQCYHKTLQSPETCTLAEIEASKEHKYLNDLMTPEELASFESIGM